MMPLKNNERINYIMRITSQFSDENNIDPIGYRFDILYFDKLVITDGICYSTFEECVKELNYYLVRLRERKLSDPLVVTLD